VRPEALSSQFGKCTASNVCVFTVAAACGVVKVLEIMDFVYFVWILENFRQIYG
jgi:hypothetical protein